MPEADRRCNGTDCQLGYLWPMECPHHCDPEEDEG